MKKLILSLVMPLFVIPIVSASIIDDLNSMDRDQAITVIQNMTNEELNSLYDQARQPESDVDMPTGDSQGSAIGDPTRSGRLVGITPRIAKYFWQGKVISESDNPLEQDLINKVSLLKRAFKAKVYVGQSKSDEGEAVIIDYKNIEKPILFIKKIRDEIREVLPNVYLGKAYYERRNGEFVMVIHFLLDFGNE